MTTFAAEYGLGKHAYYLTEADRTGARFWTWNSFTLSFAWNGLSKIAFACTMLRMVTTKWRRWFLHIAIWQLAVVASLQIIMNYVQCNPVVDLWNESPRHGTCWSPAVQQAVAMAFGSYVASMSLILSAFPLATVNTSKAYKWAIPALAGTVAVAMLAASSSVMKVIAYSGLSQRLDFTWHAQNIVLWSATENHATMIAASIPIFNSFFVGKSFQLRKDAESGRATSTLAGRSTFPSGKKANGVYELRAPPSAYRSLSKRHKDRPPSLQLAARARRSRGTPSPRRNLSHMSFLLPPSTTSTQASVQPRYPSAGYISREDQVYLGATAF